MWRITDFNPSGSDVKNKFRNYSSKSGKVRIINVEPAVSGSLQQVGTKSRGQAAFTDYHALIADVAPFNQN